MTAVEANRWVEQHKYLTLLVGPICTVALVVFAALGFGLVTPKRTLAQQAAAIDTLRTTVTVNEAARQTDRVEQKDEIHAMLTYICLEGKPSTVARIHVACVAVLKQGEIQ